MSLTVDERMRIASWEDLETAKRKLTAAEEKLTQRQQVLSSTPALRDLDWEAIVRRREEAVTVNETAARQITEELAQTRRALKQRREEWETKTALVDARERAVNKLWIETNQQVERASLALANAERRDQETTEVARTHHAAVQAWSEQKAAEERVLVARQRALDDAQARQTAECHGRHAVLDTQQRAQAAQQAALDQLESLLLKERSPELDRRAEVVTGRETSVGQREADVTKREHACTEREAGYDQEAKRLASMQLGIEEQQLAVTKRERLINRLVEKHKLTDEVKTLEGSGP